MWCETESPVWGLTVHPRRPDYTAGGSTGGEGAMFSLGGTLCGWGTDIGGSIRIPSHVNGVYGLKPSSTRLPYQGVSVSTDGQEHVPSVIGPMSRDIDSLIVVTKAVLDVEQWSLDPKCSPIPWRAESFEDVQSRPLVIAVLRDDGVVRVHPPIERVLEETLIRLRDAGHEIISCRPADGWEDIRRDVEAEGEPYIPHVEALVNRGKAISVYQYWQLSKQKLAAQERFLNLWNSTKSNRTGKQIDILLTPVMSHTAVFNIVDYPAVVLPGGHVSKELDSEAIEKMGAYKPRNALDK
ncbi:hypothetical protein LEMA_P029400.1 [Plenodomus lingam JN3]|uniref:Amidase domain-containing protein n=1 Tax=Leptosphaeria maculans (strain JN3 / isolate v23.1.3 / race Av1-4-5-6-7-8) TaxID=985895 RepID=E4ZW12_LEPMJ|nr:hypothetical protein LEMA_P029400.1 [Plenodomus lingam JN3]CBX95788.1 hypothetical protein LEMA_P029400.1 [Plenodomus lingam JN3]